ncbi:uncharacterized protein [Chlorocebus sabaeus]|uniref:uncharacterized protein isoform X3 n=1 Tax=Chlorocebus sabaeus TaxID=60711 RepID=UPI003BFA2113
METEDQKKHRKKNSGPKAAKKKAASVGSPARRQRCREEKSQSFCSSVCCGDGSILSQGAKLFYLSGMLHGEYQNQEIHNLGRFITVMKFRPLTWETSHPYVLADRGRRFCHE